MTERHPRSTFRVGLVGFFATLAVLSLSLNGYLWWVITRGGAAAPPNSLSAPAAVTSSDHARGPAAAPVTVIVYSDFECPFCRDLHVALKQLAATEKFRWVMRHFPIPTHTNAARYAEACECAGRQGKFWDFADWLFEATAGQPAVSTAPLPEGAALPLVKTDALSIDGLVDAASVMGLDGESFRQCLVTGGERARVETQKREGDSLSIAATPTLFVNGKRLVGALPVEDLQRLVSGDTP